MIDGSELNVTLGNIFEFKPRTFLFSAVVLPRFYSFDISSYYAPTSLKFFLSNDQYSRQSRKNAHAVNQERFMLRQAPA